MRRLRVGVIGLGTFAESHIRAYQSLPNVEVAAVASHSRERAAAIATEYGIPTWYESYDALIGDASVEAISVTTAESDHRDPAIQALAAGKHVLVEKPLAATTADAQAIVDAAREASGILMLGHILRFDPKYAAIREAAVKGELGRLVSLSARRNRPRSLIAGYDRVHPALVTAIHDIDIMLWVAQRRVRWVRAVDRLADRDGGAHGLWGLLEFEGGLVGTIETVWLVPDAAGIRTDDAFEAIGLEGTAKLQLDVSALRLWRTQGSEVPDTSYEAPLHGAMAGALKEELAHFVACALSGKPSPVVRAEDGLNALQSSWP
ncbi:MAG TPA: Gfo/Idh/MocA family oxidoreductase [Thermomicrobiales bacterium]|nr:Gfo/Idh/MocA family oxidoreductase [Thermomicrobiales bacterium]